MQDSLQDIHDVTVLALIILKGYKRPTRVSKLEEYYS